MTILETAEKHCTETGARLTEPRRRVLEIIAGTPQPIGAYDIIDAMPKGTKPPTVYRALEFWMEEGFVHRISSLNVYTICHAGHRHDGAQFLICRQCGTITEMHICDMPDAFKAVAQKQGFAVEGWFLEMHGLCSKCTDNAVPASGSCCAH